MAAEWEPAVAVLIAWPLSLPKELLIELAKETKLYLLVQDLKAKQEAVQWLMKWKITPDRIKFITAPQGVDVAWTRDWGPHAVFTPDGQMKLADGKYLFATPVTGLSCTDSLQFLYYDENHKIQMTKVDDVIPDYIASSTELELLPLPFAFTGGNVITDGQRSGFSTCILTNENRYLSVADEKLFAEIQQLLGMDQYHVIPNFEADGIQHIDCFMKMLDEERLFVMRPPSDHPAFPIYEKIVKQDLAPLKNAYGRPYQILRLDTKPYNAEGDLAAYSNSLILNQTVYVPLFGIPQDSVALKQWQEAMPGYAVKGFLFPVKPEPYYQPGFLHMNEASGRTIGWNSGDALHCRVRAVWDPNMIYMSMDRIPATVPKAKTYTFNVIIKDYSTGGLIPESLMLRWRMRGEETWKDVRLLPTGFPDQFSAAIQGKFGGATVEYYAEAKSNWGTVATIPRVAPKGFYSFSVN